MLSKRFFSLVASLAAVLFTANSVSAQCYDVYEPNDDCASAAPLTAGSYSGLTVRGPAVGSNPDFFSVPLAAGERILVDCTHVVENGDLDLFLYDAASPGCGNQLAPNPLDSSEEYASIEHVSWTNTTGAAVTVIIEVAPWHGDTGYVCNSYTLDVVVATNICLTAVEDVLEPNDDCASALPLATGTYTGLTVSDVDLDYYLLTVPPGEHLFAGSTHPSGPGIPTAQIKLYSDLACLNLLDVDSGFDGSGQVDIPNTTGAPITCVVSVEAYGGLGFCTDYDLSVWTVPDPCTAVPDDVFEENDECESASVAPVGLTTGLRMFGVYAWPERDFWVVQAVPADTALVVDVLFSHVQCNLGVHLYDNSACFSPSDASTTNTDNEQVSIVNTTGAPKDYYFQIEGAASTGNCTDYDLMITLLTDPCSLGTDDALEPNDQCSTAVPLGAGAHTGLVVRPSSYDYYTVQVPASETLTVTSTYGTVGTLRTDLLIHEGTSCPGPVETGLGSNGAAQVEWVNDTGATVDVTLAVILGGAGDCLQYDLDVSTAPFPCLDPLLEDGFEDNDDCVTATPMSAGSTLDLFVRTGDEDVFSLILADGETVDLHLTASDYLLEVHLFDEAAPSCGDSTGGTALASAAMTPFGDLDLSFTNTSGSPLSLVVMVAVLPNGNPVGECTSYDMDIAVGGGSLATPFCFGDGSTDFGGGAVHCPCGNDSAGGAGEGCLHSQGVGAVLSASGTNVVANDDLVFQVAQARPNQPGMLVQGSTRIALPFKDGILCAGNPTRRVEVVSLNSAGAASTASSIVTEGAVQVGRTRHYQLWFRDPSLSVCGTGSNFTQGLTVLWH